MNKFFFSVLVLITLSSCLPQLQYYSSNQGDKNENGVRDDIEEYINSTYEDLTLRKALYQYSHDSLETLTPNLSKEEIIKNYNRLNESGLCVWFVVAGPDMKAHYIKKEIRLRELNNISNWYADRVAAEAIGLAQPPYISIKHHKILNNPSIVCRFKIEEEVANQYRKRIQKYQPGLIR